MISDPRLQNISTLPVRSGGLITSFPIPAYIPRPSIIATAEAFSGAFPGAMGHGRNSQGARAGTGPITVHLCNNYTEFETAVNSCTGQGDIIVAQSSGDWNRAAYGTLVWDAPNVTFLGNIAPSPGVMWSNVTTNIRASQQILIGFAARGGNGLGGADDVIVFGGGSPFSNVILDHFESSWFTDGALDVNANSGNIQYLTFSNFAAGEGVSTHNLISLLNNNLGGNKPDFVSYYRGYFHSGGRTPLISEDLDAEVVNCVIYNWASAATNIQLDTKANIVGNRYKDGPQTAGTTRCVDMEGYASVLLYIKDNYGGDRVLVSDPENFIIPSSQRSTPGINTVTPQATLSNIDLANNLTGLQIEADIKNNAGNYYQDSVRTRWTTEYDAGTDSVPITSGNFPAFPTYAVNQRDMSEFNTWAAAAGFVGGAYTDIETLYYPATNQNWTATLIEHWSRTLTP